MPSTTVSQKSASAVLAPIDQWLPDLEALYRDLHAHPEPARRGDGAGRARDDRR
jgi:hypothetical protein